MMFPLIAVVLALALNTLALLNAEPGNLLSIWPLLVGVPILIAGCISLATGGLDR